MCTRQWRKHGRNRLFPPLQDVRLDDLDNTGEEVQDGVYCGHEPGDIRRYSTKELLDGFRVRHHPISCAIYNSDMDEDGNVRCFWCLMRHGTERRIELCEYKCHCLGYVYYEMQLTQEERDGDASGGSVHRYCLLCPLRQGVVVTDKRRTPGEGEYLYTDSMEDMNKKPYTVVSCDWEVLGPQRRLTTFSWPNSQEQM